MGKRKKAQKLKRFKQAAISSKSPCPHCKEIVGGDASTLKKHYQAEHGRQPTSAEIFRFRAYKKKNGGGYSVGYHKDHREVSGGLPGLGKR